MVRYLGLVILFCSLTSVVKAQSYSDSTLLKKLLGKDELVDKVLQNREKYRLQVVLSRYEKNELVNHIDWSKDEYFYPASLVKLPTVIAALIKMKSLGIRLDDYIIFHDDGECGSNKFCAKTRTEKLTFRKLIKETIVVSDNDFYNVLYHFSTPALINSVMKEIHCDSTKIYRCFSGCEKEMQVLTLGYDVFDLRDSLVFQSDGDSLEWNHISKLFHDSQDKHVGLKRMEGKSYIHEPYDFCYNLEYPVHDLQNTMLSLLNWTDSSSYWIMDEQDHKFLLECMTLFPRELGVAKYRDSRKYADNAFKIIAFGDPDQVRDNIVTYSKIGYSYGFICETAAVKNTSTEEIFFLTISMYVNANNTMNDGRYEYNSIATPFMGRFTNILIDYLNNLE